MVIHNLPAQTTPFVGRTLELADIRALLVEPACRLLTLVGPGGIGKTRLAIETARRFPFSERVHFIPFQPLTSPDFLVSALADEVGFKFHAGRDPKQQLLEHLHEKSWLLLLDNYEHLLDGAGLLAEILAFAPDVRLLVTSRERLNLVEEWVLEVGGLAYPPGEDVSDPERYSAVELFVQRARQAKVGFVLTDKNRPAVIRICRLVGGMPLGIELAAAWVRVLPCDQLAEEIEHSLQILETPARNVPPRHRSMRAAFTPTWERLSDAERDVFIKLSVFRGGFTREAAAAVTGASLQSLSSLADKSLLCINANERYDIHELLRQYGGDHLIQSGNSDSTHDIHSAYFADFCSQREQDIKGRRQIEALNEIEDDFENVRTAWLWALEQGIPNTIDRVLESLFLFCEMRGRYHEMDELLREAVVGFAPTTDKEPNQVWGRLIARSFFIWRGGVELRRERLEQALAIAQQFDDRADIGYCLWRLGEFSIEYGSLSDTLTYLEQSLTHYREIKDRYYIAKVLNEFGNAYRERRDAETAISFHRQSLDLRRDIGDLRGIGWCLYDISRSHYQLGHYGQAEGGLQEAASIWRQINERFGVRGAVDILGNIALLRGEFELARSLSEEALQLTTDLGVQRYYSSRALTNLGVLASVQGDYSRGQRLCEQSLEMLFLATSRSFVYWGHSLTACGLNNYHDARQSLMVSISDALQNDHIDQMLRSLPVAAVILAHENQPVWAVELLGLAFTYPDNVTAWLKKWPLMTHLHADLKMQLGAQVYTQAWEQGKAGRVEALITVLLAHFQAEDESQAAAQTANRALVEPLSQRELEVLRLIAQGLSNQEIAERLVVGIATVKKHINHLYSKLGVQSRTQALIRSREWKLI